MKADRWVVVGALVLTAVYWYAIHQIREPMIGDPIGPRAIPKLLAVGLFISAIWLLIESWTPRKSAPKPDAGRSAEPALPAAVKPVKGYVLIASIVAATLLYFWVFNWLGYALATLLYLSGLMLHFNPGRTRMNLLSALGFSLGTYVAFTRVFGAQLPAGLLPF